MSQKIHSKHKKKQSKGDHVGHVTIPFWLPQLLKNLCPQSSGNGRL